MGMALKSREISMKKFLAMAHNAIPEVKYVLLDGLVVTKIIKHCHEEVLSGQDVVNGVLLGLAQDDRLEITNCFPYPRLAEDDTNITDTTTYEIDMLRHLRQINIDYLSIGIYQSGYGGTFLNRTCLENLFTYQSSISEAILLVYDPTHNARGQISIKAYRLTPEMLSVLQDAQKEEETAGPRHNDPDWQPEVLQNMRLNFTQLFEEIPVIIRNSHLINLLLTDLDDRLPQTDRFKSLDLGVGASMERQLKLLMNGMDETCQDIQKHVNYQKQTARYQQAMQAKNDQGLRTRDHERPPSGVPRLETTLICAQVNQYCQELSELAGQTMGKLMMTQGVQQTRRN